MALYGLDFQIDIFVPTPTIFIAVRGEGVAEVFDDAYIPVADVAPLGRRRPIHTGGDGRGRVTIDGDGVGGVKCATRRGDNDGGCCPGQRRTESGGGG